MQQLRAVVATLQHAFPAEHDRIGRGVNVLLTAEIRETATTGRYLVQSCQDSARYYEASTWACDCPDHQRHPELRCKHSHAIDILHIAGAIAAREQAERRSASCPVCGDWTGGAGLCRACQAREMDFARVHAATATVQARRAKVA